jgi:hypothetical protein
MPCSWWFASGVNGCGCVFVLNGLVPIVNAPDGEGAPRTTKNLWIDKRSSKTHRERDRTMSWEIQLSKMKMEKKRVLPRFAG